MDEDLEKFWNEIIEENYLNNSMLVFLGDHGPRFSKDRNSINGKLEERLPLLAIVMPPWFIDGHEFQPFWKTLLEN